MNLQRAGAEVEVDVVLVISQHEGGRQWSAAQRLPSKPHVQVSGLVSANPRMILRERPHQAAWLFL